MGVKGWVGVSGVEGGGEWNGQIVWLITAEQFGIAVYWLASWQA